MTLISSVVKDHKLKHDTTAVFTHGCNSNETVSRCEIWCHIKFILKELMRLLFSKLHRKTTMLFNINEDYNVRTTRL